MTDKQIKEEIKQVVTNLGNIEFTVEDELKFCKEVLKRKEQECEGLNKTVTSLENIRDEFSTKLDQLKEKNKWYDHYKESALRNKELYNDLSIKYDKLKAENEHLAEKEEESRHYLEEASKFKQALQEIKDYCNKYPQNSIGFKQQILQKCEVIKDE